MPWSPKVCGGDAVCDGSRIASSHGEDRPCAWDSCLGGSAGWKNPLSAVQPRGCRRAVRVPSTVEAGCCWGRYSCARANPLACPSEAWRVRMRRSLGSVFARRRGNGRETIQLKAAAQAKTGFPAQAWRALRCALAKESVGRGGQRGIGRTGVWREMEPVLDAVTFRG